MIDKTKRPEALGTAPIDAGSFRGSFSGNERDVFFLNPPGDGPFFQIAYGLGLDLSDDGRAVLPFDFDGDGDLDLARISLQRLRLLENRLGAKHSFVRFNLKATKSQHHALGAKVRVTAGGVTQLDYVKLTAGFQTQVPLELHFGLADATQVDRVEIEWPSGTKETHADLAVNQRYALVEGTAPTTVALPRWDTATRPRPLAPHSLDAEADRLAGGRAPLAELGRPLVVNFWAPWCKPCAEELPAFVRAHRTMKDRVQFVGVSVETKDKASVTAAVKKYGMVYDQRYADDALMASFFGEDGSAPLPSTFVFGSDGKLARAFYRKIEQADLQAVVDSLTDHRLSLAFALPIGETLLAQGDIAAAKREFSRGLERDPNDVVLLAQLGSALSEEGDQVRAIETLRQAVKLDPAFAYGWYRLGVAYKRAAKLDDATAALEHAVEIHPAGVKYLLSLGAVYAQTAKMERALDSFEKAVALNAGSVEGWLNLGKARINLKRPGGVDAFEKVLDLDPAHAEAKALLNRFKTP